MTMTFETALAARVDEMADACTRCGKCVEVCPVTGPGGVKAALASEASGQRGNSLEVRAHSASEDARERADDTRPEAGSSARGARASFHAVDITDYAAVARAVETFEKDVGPVALLVNNAGWDRALSFLDSTP